MPAATPASFETIRNHKVQAGELNSSQITSATLAGEYKARPPTSSSCGGPSRSRTIRSRSGAG